MAVAKKSLLDESTLERILVQFEQNKEVNYSKADASVLDIERHTKGTDLFFVLTDLMMYQNAELFETSFLTLLKLYLPRMDSGCTEDDADSDALTRLGEDAKRAHDELRADFANFRNQRRWKKSISRDFDLLVRRFLHIDQPQVLKALVPGELLRQKNLGSAK